MRAVVLLAVIVGADVESFRSAFGGTDSAACFSDAITTLNRVAPCKATTTQNCAASGGVATPWKIIFAANIVHMYSVVEKLRTMT